MDGIKQLQEKLHLPRVSQIGVVVRNMEKAVENYESIFGLGPFTVYEFVPDRHWYMEEPSPLRILMGKAMWGDIEWELLQPLEGRSLHQEFLDTHGEGLQHLGFNVQHYDQVFGRMLKAGFKPLMRTETFVEIYDGHLRACYFDTSRVGGVICEIIWKSWLPECQ